MKNLDDYGIDALFREDPHDLKAALARMGSDSPTGSLMREHFAADMVDLYTQFLCDDYECKSPIEKLFMEAIYAIAPSYGAPIAYSAWELNHFNQTGVPPTPSLHVRPQFDITLEKKYRVDFLVVGLDNDHRKPVRVVVECDGHDFHERTKEQAAKDRSRDRDLQANGFAIFRFTGRELHADALACAKQVVAFIRCLPKNHSIVVTHDKR